MEYQPQPQAGIYNPQTGQIYPAAPLQVPYAGQPYDASQQPHQQHYYPPPAAAADAYSQQQPQVMIYTAAPASPPPSCCDATAIPGTTPLALGAYALQSAGGVALGLGVLFLVSTGWALLSSILLIAQGCLLRSAGASSEAMGKVVGEAAAPQAPAGACCGRARHANLRGLAVATTVFAALELLLGLGLGLGLGISLLYAPLQSSGSGTLLRVCGSVAGQAAPACLSSVTSSELLYLSSGGSLSTYTTPLALVRKSDIGGSQYLLWAAGTTFFQAVVNIALSAHTMHLCRVVVALSNGIAGGARM